MADVFVSYKAEDRRRVHPLVQALEADGVTVWWDAHIGGGDDWREQIQRNLDDAKCVVVVWSKYSVGRDGHFVRDEASRAQRRHAYLPVRIDKVEPPLGFGETQALPLFGWGGQRKDKRYQAVLAAARAIVAGTPRTEQVLPIKLQVNRRTALAGGAAVAVTAAAGGWFLLKPGSANAANSVAVLPFANLSRDADQAYFADGLAEELRGALSRLGHLKVIGRVSSEAVRNTESTQAASKLQVASLVTGSVRRSPSVIRVSAQLIDGEDGSQRWAETYDRPPGDLLAVQTDIAENVARSLSVQLGQSERDALAAGSTKNPAAQDLYLKANALWISEQTDAAGKRAIGLLDAALALDPSFANAHAMKSIFLTANTGTFANDPLAYTKGFAAAEGAAREAIRIAPNLALGYVGLADVARSRLDAITASQMYERALSYSPNDPDAVTGYGRLLGDLGRSAGALRRAEQVVSLDPLNGGNHSFKALMLFYARRYREAVNSARRALQITPKRHIARARVGDALVMLGEAQKALAEFRQMPEGDPWRLTGEAIADARLGNRRGSDKALKELLRLYGDPFSYQQAEIYAQRGEPERAFAALNQALQIRDPGLLSIRADPFLDPLRSDPRLEALVRALRLP